MLGSGVEDSTKTGSEVVIGAGSAEGGPVNGGGTMVVGVGY